VRRAIVKHRRDFAALVALVAVASGVALYVLQHQRLRIPLLEEKAFILKAEFETAQAVTPGQGQTVRVSGVRIGDIGKVELRRTGTAVITMEIDRKYEDLVHTDASALLRPKTGLKDMFIELSPGSHDVPLAKEGWTMPLRTTLPDVNPDEFLASLDTDTRDYLKLLLSGAGKGLKGRGADLQDALARFEPTYRDIAAVSSQVALRRRELRRLISSLNKLNAEVASKDDDLAELITTSSRVFRAFASESNNVSATVGELPSTLRQATRTLNKVDTMARILRPTSDKLVPVAGAIVRANKATTPYALEAAPLLRRDIRPFVRELRPLVRDLRPTARDLNTAEPFLTRSFTVLNHLFNLLGYNPEGRENPDKATREEGYLFHLAWLQHQTANLFSSGDAHGPGRPITTGGTCATLRALTTADPASALLQAFGGPLTDPAICAGGQP
jgi:phospholipid/cholesterol/gamma-HCH transport system substrate-binding protein